jgi:hypothetical protein
MSIRIGATVTKQGNAHHPSAGRLSQVLNTGAMHFGMKQVRSDDTERNLTEYLAGLPPDMAQKVAAHI